MRQVEQFDWSAKEAAERPQMYEITFANGVNYLPSEQLFRQFKAIVVAELQGRISQASAELAKYNIQAPTR